MYLWKYKTIFSFKKIETKIKFFKEIFVLFFNPLLILKTFIRRYLHKALTVSAIYVRNSHNNLTLKQPIKSK